MPAFSVSLDESTMKSIRKMAKKQGISASCLVHEVLTRYLRSEQRKESRCRVRQILQAERPLGPSSHWMEIHRDRTGTEAGRTSCRIHQRSSGM